MHVFICWSGGRSKAIAAALYEWLPTVLGAEITCDVSMSLEPGTEWFPKLLGALEKADAAIVCLTPENLAAAWMHFESGMVFRAGKGRVFPYAVALQLERINAPLNAYQAV